MFTLNLSRNNFEYWKISGISRRLADVEIRYDPSPDIPLIKSNRQIFPYIYQFFIYSIKF